MQTSVYLVLGALGYCMVSCLPTYNPITNTEIIWWNGIGTQPRSYCRGYSVWVFHFDAPTLVASIAFATLRMSYRLTPVGEWEGS